MSTFRHILTGIFIATAFILGMYGILILMLDVPFINSGFYVPSLTSVIVGVVLGYLYNQRKNKENSLLVSLEQQSILKEISLLPHKIHSLKEILDKSIHLILYSSFTKLQSRGGIFLTTEKNKLELKSQLNLSEEILSNCGTKGVEFGECLCGMAAQEKKTIFKPNVDKAHSNKNGEIEDHGHYNIPILHEDEVLGVIVVYLNKGHKENQVEISFLEGVANVLALIISNYYSNQKIFKKDSVLKEIQQFARIGTWTRDIKTGRYTGSDEVFKIMGYAPNEIRISEKFFLDSIHPSDTFKINESIKSVKKGVSFESEIRFFKKDGSIVSVINKSYPIINQEGTITEISGTIIDVSQIRKSEAELKEKQNLVDGILSTTPDPLFLLDIETSELVYCNTPMNDLLSQNPLFLQGYKKQGISNFRKHVHPDDLVIYDKLNYSLRKGKDSHTLIFRTKIFSDKYHWVEETVKVFSRRTNGKIHQLLVVVKDISDKMHAENRVKKLNIELSSQNRSIKKINTELDQFVYSVSHDLRAPLSSMLGLVNLSKLGSKPEDLKEYMHRIGQSVEKLDGFIKDILDYSRNSRTELEINTIVLKNLFLEIIDNIKSVNNPDIDLDFESKETYLFNGDIRRIRIIFNNIISNTVKYADYTKPKRILKVRIKTTIDACIIVFEDNGIGISKESLAKIFNMFYRGTDKSNGSGLGMYIVNETIQKMNGSVRVESEEGVGTKVFIQIPQSKKQGVSTKKRIKSRTLKTT